VKKNLITRGGAGLLLAFALALPSGALAQGQEKQEKKQHSLNEKTGEAFQKLKPLQDAKNWTGMIQLLDSIVPLVGPTSYDMALILDMKAKLYLQQDLLAKAIEPWEQALRLSDQHEYFDEKTSNDIALYLAQIIMSEATNIKDPAGQQQMINKALGYLKRHLANSKKPSIETQMLYAQLLYQQAVADPNKINQDLLKQAREVVEKGMLSTLQPKEGFYMLLLAILQQQNETQRSAELLEIIAKKFPGKKDYWPLLMATYLNLATTEKNPERQREHYIRAINTTERAQALGFMKTPKDNYNLVTIYITAGQFSKATEILHAGLKNGSIESTLGNWRILGSYYQQANKELMAIEALKEAAKLFPTEGMLDLQIGEIYRQLEKTKEARDFYQSAIRKGKLEKPQVAYQLVAYTSMELDDWDTAKQAIDKAAQSPEFAKDQQMKSLKDHIDNTVREREEQRKIKEEDQKKKQGAAKTL
jgi:hypothetical protein